MTEKDKMRRGEWHDANFDEELIADRERAAELCDRLNLPGASSEEKAAALRDLLGTELPEGLTILPPVYFDYGKYTRFDSGCFVNHGCYFMDGGTVTIGKNVFIGPFCGFYTVNHPLTIQEREKGLERALPIVIGDHCWLGANVTVLQGVTIGSGCVIAAGSVVKDSLPDNTLAAGVPAVVKKKIQQNAE